MRLRIRGPAGQTTAELPDDASIGQLKELITAKTSIADFDVKFRYPPVPLAIADFPDDSKLSDWGIDLNGEQLLISDKAPPVSVMLGYIYGLGHPCYRLLGPQLSFFIPESSIALSGHFIQ